MTAFVYTRNRKSISAAGIEPAATKPPNSKVKYSALFPRSLNAQHYKDDDGSADSEGTDTLKKPTRQSPAYSNVEMDKGLSRREKNRCVQNIKETAPDLEAGERCKIYSIFQPY